MDRHPQQIKRHRQDTKRQAANKARMSHLRTSVKKALAATKATDAEPLVKEAVKIIDKAAVKGLIHRNTAARRKSQVTRHLNSLAGK